MTSLVFEQFLRRRQNQVIFGFFVGLGVYAVVHWSRQMSASAAR